MEPFPQATVGASQSAPAPVVQPSAPPSDWTTVAPIQRVVTAPQRVLDTTARPPTTFVDPRMTSAHLVHNVTSDAPSGVIHGLLSARIGQPQSLDLPMPPLPVVPRPPSPHWLLMPPVRSS